MKLLALVPARGGSKRLPNKNIRKLGGKPLIQWTIDIALGIPEIIDVLVSTDSPAIAKVAKEAGAMVPWLRPAELASDTATSMEVCMHALEWYEKEKGPIDGLILLQPTSPFRTANTIRCAIELFCEHPHRSVVSFSEAESHPMWCYSVNDNNITPFLSYEDRSSRSQDLPPAYVINGAIYIAAPKYLRENKSYIGKDTLPLIMEVSEEIIDIDTTWDWKIAEYFVEYNSQ